MCSSDLVIIPSISNVYFYRTFCPMPSQLIFTIDITIQLVTMFGVSVDEYIFPDNEVKRSSIRRRLDAELDKLNDKELSIVEATVSGLCKAKEPEE